MAQEFLITIWDDSGEILINTTYEAETAYGVLDQYLADRDPIPPDHHRPRAVRIEIKPTTA